MKDWLVRSLKTFVQAFFGVLIPEAVAIFSNILNYDFSAWKTWLIPIICAAIAAGLSAAWNGYLEHTKKDTDITR